MHHHHTAHDLALLPDDGDYLEEEPTPAVQATCLTDGHDPAFATGLCTACGHGPDLLAALIGSTDDELAEFSGAWADEARRWPHGPERVAAMQRAGLAVNTMRLRSCEGWERAGLAMQRHQLLAGA